MFPMAYELKFYVKLEEIHSDMGSSLGRRDVKPATNSLSYGAA
jgi:hypothetical protein